MDNRELIYRLARVLDMEIIVHKGGEFVGRYKFIDGKLHKKEIQKLDIDEKQKHESLQLPGERNEDRRD